jgi:peptidoglycan lytic transglycosylase
MRRGVRIRVEAHQLRRVHWGAAAVLATILAVTFGPRGQSGASSSANAPAVLRGDATYLADFFHGRESASGEIFDQRKMVAAHRWLPFGSRVRVTNLQNGRSVSVRIVDRGPYGRNFREGTIIDLSKAAATELRMLRDGQVHVRVVVLSIGNGKRVDRPRDS